MVLPVPSRAGGIPIRFAPILIALALFAGCIGGEDPVESTSVEKAEDPALPSPAAPAANTTTAAIVATEPRDFPISFQGKTGTWVCAPSGPSSCQGLPVSTDSENTFVLPEYDGLAKSIEVTLTWSATTPATQEMYVFVGAMRSCGENCFETDGEMFATSAQGQSPLSLSASDVTLRADEVLFVHVGTVDPTPSTPAPFFYSLEQAFAVEGKLTALVNATA